MNKKCMISIVSSISGITIFPWFEFPTHPNPNPNSNPNPNPHQETIKTKET